ncbi:MAG: TIGR03086 family metal-binding protein [Ilumatobacteraceae bacterium]
MNSSATSFTAPDFAIDPNVDPRPQLATALDVARSTVLGVTADQLTHPTPCSDFDVEHLAAHLLAVLVRIAAIGNGNDPMAQSDSYPVEFADWSGAWDEHVDAVNTAWATGARLDEVVHLPWSQETGRVTLLTYLNELSVHTWDLATATGQSPNWDGTVLAYAFAGIRRGLPAEGRRETFEAIFASVPAEVRAMMSFPFAEATDVPASAPLIDQLVAWNGRRPR